MRIEKKFYVIASVGHPLKFENEYGEEVDRLELACHHDTRDSAENELTKYNFPDEYQILEVNSILEF